MSDRINRLLDRPGAVFKVFAAWFGLCIAFGIIGATLFGLTGCTKLPRSLAPLETPQPTQSPDYF